MTEVLSQDLTAQRRSAGVTAAAAVGLLGSISAFFVWGWFFASLLSLPVDSRGQHAYQLHPVAFFSIGLLPPLLIAMGVRTSIGLFQLRPWARRGALLWAALALAFSSAVIAFQPYETFVIREDFVAPEVSLKQLLAISFVIFTFPVGAWWLVYFTRRHVIKQFQPDSPENRAPE